MTLSKVQPCPPADLQWNFRFTGNPRLEEAAAITLETKMGRNILFGIFQISSAFHLIVTCCSQSLDRAA